MEYGSNSKKDKLEKPQEEKIIEKVIVGDISVQKKTLGRKFKDLFVEADFKSVMKYVVSDVLLPAARNTIVDASTKGIERMMYGDRAVSRRNYGAAGRITYNDPINRGYSSVGSRQAPPVQRGSRTRRNAEDFILSSREEAELVLERMNDIIETYDVVSVGDLNELVGFPTTHIDNKWGWVFLGNVQIRQIREGYLIDLPPAEPIV